MLAGRRSRCVYGELCVMARIPPPRGVNAHYAIAAVAVTVLINRRKDIKLIPELLQRNGGQTRKVRAHDAN